jgi:hypothetical protein
VSSALYQASREPTILVEDPITSLFDDFVRTDASPSAESEDYFTFLNRVDTPFWAEVRRVLNAWFSRYPSQRAPGLWQEFRSRRARQQRGAFWELYLHELFLQLGYQVVVHPELADTSHTPDFELRRDGRRLYVEARVMSSEIILDEDEIRPPPWLLDAIEKIRNHDFDLQLVGIAQAGPVRPKDTEITGAIDAWLDQLDPDDYSDADAPAAAENAVRFRGWEVVLSAWPRHPDERGSTTRRKLAIGFMEVGGINDVGRLRSALKAKAGRYGRPGVPLVTAVLCDASFLDRRDVAATLFGSEAIRYRMGELGSARLVRDQNGFWFWRGKPTNRRVSGVLVAKQLHPSSVTEVAPDLWLNPWAVQPLEEEWPFTTATADDRGDVLYEERDPDMAGVLALPSHWPDGEAFPKAQ